MKHFTVRKDDTEPPLRALDEIVSTIFRLAEYVLIAGAFVFLAFATENWAVILIAAMLGLALSVLIMSWIAQITFLNWRRASGRASKILLMLLDIGIFLASSWIVITALKAVAKAFETGIGI